MKKKARKTLLKHCSLARTLFSTVPLSVLLAAWSARGQEGLSDAMANEQMDRARADQAHSENYTFRDGDFRMLLVPSLSMQYNDNINCSDTGEQSDFIVLPTLGVLMSYPLTDRNLLQVNVTAGYSKYLIHPQLSSWYVSTGSGFSFDVYIKDIIINLHDQISYQQNSAGNADVAGTGTYGALQNSTGLSARWSLRYIDFTLGYDHQITHATSAQFANTDNSTESAYGRAGYRWNPALTTGLEGSFSYTAYDQNVLNDTTAYSVGVYGDWHPDKYLEVEPRVGYVINEFGNSGQVKTSGLDSWYADLLVTHKITRSFSYSIDAGKNVSAAAQASADKYWFANASLTWNFIRNFSFSPKFFIQNGTQGAGNLPLLPGQKPVLNVVSGENYDWYGCSLGFNYDITRRFTMGMNYQFTQRTSSQHDRGYTQNLVGIQITYHTI